MHRLALVLRLRPNSLDESSVVSVVFGLASGQDEHEHEDLLGLEGADLPGLEHIDAEWQF